MSEEKRSVGKMKASLIVAGLVVYILLGAAAITVYAFDTGLIGEKKPGVSFSPVPYGNGTVYGENDTDESQEQDYDTAGGTAGAARDF